MTARSPLSAISLSVCTPLPWRHISFTQISLPRNHVLLAHCLLDLLLRSQLVAVSALLLPAVRRPRRQPCIALSADHLVAVVLGRQRFEGGFDDAAAETEDEVEGGFLGLSALLQRLDHVEWATTWIYVRGNAMVADLLNVVVAQCTPIFKLLAGEDQTLLVRRDAFFVLNLALDIVDGIGGFDLEGDGLSREGLDEAGGTISTRYMVVKEESEVERVRLFGRWQFLHLHY